MREPKAEEDYVVTTVRLPGEEIGLNKAHPLVTDPGRRDREHFWRRVHGGDICRVAQELAGPYPGAACEFKHTPSWPEGLKRLVQLIAARKIKDMVEILRTESLVVGGLLIKEPTEFLTVS